MALNLDGTGPITGVSRLTGDTSSGDLILQADPTGAEADSIIGLEIDGSEKARLDASGNLLIGGTLPASPNISLNADGSGSFGGQAISLLAGTNTKAVNIVTTDTAAKAVLGLYGATNASQARGKLQLTSVDAATGSNTQLVELGTVSNPTNIVLESDGSAEFADDVTIGDYANQNGSLILARGQGIFKREAVGAIALTNLQVSANVYGFACGSLDAAGNTDYKALINIDGSSTFSGRLLAGTNTPIADTTTALVQSNSQVIAPQGVSTANGGWSMLATSRVTLTNAPDGINGHTVQINLAGINGNNNATLLRVSFAMRRGNSGSAFSQKSQYMGLWDATRISTDQSIDTNDIVTSAITVVSTTYVSDVITFTFNTDNVRSFTARAIEYCTTGTLYTEA